MTAPRCTFCNLAATMMVEPDGMPDMPLCGEHYEEMITSAQKHDSLKLGAETVRSCMERAAYPIGCDE